MTLEPGEGGGGEVIVAEALISGSEARGPHRLVNTLHFPTLSFGHFKPLILTLTDKPLTFPSLFLC